MSTGSPARSTGIRRPTPSRAGFATRLMLAQALVLGAGALTTWLVASGVGPGLFHDHLAQAGDTHTAAETRHLEEAFASALLVSLTVAVLATIAAALGVSWYISRRVQRSISEVTGAAEQIAAGSYGTRVSSPGLGTEFDTLAHGYNALAARLEATETSRRRMLGDLAHEMRTPLATVEAHLEAVEDGVRALDAATLTVLRGSTERLRRLAEDISAVSRAEEGQLPINPRSVNAAQIAHAASQAARERYAAASVQLHTHLAHDLVVTADPDRLGQVLGNLLDNALRHSNPGDTVTLTCRKTDGWVTYTVTDTGQGIAAEHLPYLFDRFYRTETARDREHGGSGIGLSIARALVAAHGGCITAHSDGSGLGATFTVRLPQSRA